MNNEIEAALANLTGLAFVDSNRAVDMEMFHFGDANEPEYALHIQCPWRIERDGALVVGYRDMRDPPSGVPAEAFDPNEGAFTRRDELLDAYFLARQPSPRRVVEARAVATGDVRLVLDDGCALAVFPDSVAQDDEYWRMIDLRGGDQFVAGGGGFERMSAEPPRSSDIGGH